MKTENTANPQSPVLPWMREAARELATDHSISSIGTLAQLIANHAPKSPPPSDEAREIAEGLDTLTCCIESQDLDRAITFLRNLPAPSAPAVDILAKLGKELPAICDAANESASGCPPDGYTDLAPGSKELRLADNCYNHGLQAMQTAVSNWVFDERQERSKASAVPQHVQAGNEAGAKLVALARAAWRLADDTEGTEYEDEFGKHLRVPSDNFKELSDALDALDQLPELPAPYIGTGPAKAEHSLRFPSAPVSGDDTLRRLAREVCDARSITGIADKLDQLRAHLDATPEAGRGGTPKAIDRSTLPNIKDARGTYCTPHPASESPPETDHIKDCLGLCWNYGLMRGMLMGLTHVVPKENRAKIEEVLKKVPEDIPESLAPSGPPPAVNAKLVNLAGSLQLLLDRYTSLVNSGDAGNWDPEKEPEVIAARAALTDAGVKIT